MGSAGVGSAPWVHSGRGIDALLGAQPRTNVVLGGPCRGTLGGGWLAERRAPLDRGRLDLSVGRVLAAEVAAGRMDEAEVEPTARGILAGNSEWVYRLQDPA